MNSTITLRGVPVEFPYEPYDIQKDYMEKVIECIQNETTAVLESPTGTGKTLSLLCSSLAWLQQKKAQIQAQRQLSVGKLFGDKPPDFLQSLLSVEERAAELKAAGKEFLGVPTIIYASRTHSQLSQAVQEMKKTAYKHMTVSVLGSRDQLCIHPEVLAESDRTMRLHMCRLKLASRLCHYNNRVESKKEDPDICNTPIIDIEDMVKLGKKHVFCPYYMTKDRQQKADIIFTPYNYLLDPVARKSLGLKLANSVVILDEGHNVEKVCEESASVEIKSTDIALAIEETTGMMKLLADGYAISFEESAKGDIDPEQLANLKLVLIEFEKALDEVPLNTIGDEVTNFPGDFVYELLENAQITSANVNAILALIDSIAQFLSAQNDGPFARKGKGLQLFADFLTIVFQSTSSKEKIKHCYKVHIKVEDTNRPGRPQIKTWLDKGSTSGKCRILCFWCFSPGFGMDLILSQGIRGLILTSGTLAPLKPLISELELKVTVSLENPHIVKDNQICVKILPKGPDGEPLNSSYRNRDNPRYVASLGNAIVNLTNIVPNGLLIFFPSYPIMQKCQNSWEADGIWSSIASKKAIFVEPKGKDAFNEAMLGYYEKIHDPTLKGAIFMGVCRGKVSEGLDFADANGRAVIITGLPYPPLKDPKIILKRRYLDTCHSRDKEYLTGGDWYSLEATRAVNQAIGRVIRHKDDFGAILLLDERFNSPIIKGQMSKWLRGHIKVTSRYGEMIRDLSQFFRKAQNELPTPKMRSLAPQNASFDIPKTYRKGNFDFGASNSSSCSSDLTGSPCDNQELMKKYLGVDTSSNIPKAVTGVNSEKRDQPQLMTYTAKRKRIHLTGRTMQRAFSETANTPLDPKESMKEYVAMVKSKLGSSYTAFADALKSYRETKDIDAFIEAVESLIPCHLRYILSGLDAYILQAQKETYRIFLRRNNLFVPEDL